MVGVILSKGSHLDNFYVYRHIRPDTNEVFYIGKGLEGTNRHLSKHYRNEYWRNIVNKNNGQYEIEIMVGGLTEDEAISKEIEFIKLYGRFQNGGTLCNMTDGGEGTIGRKHSKETRIKLASYGFEGKLHSEETKELIRYKAKLRGRPKNAGKPKKKCIGENLITGEKKEFNSYAEAEVYTTVNHNHIRKLVKGVGKQCKNWTFFSLTRQVTFNS